MKKNLTQIIRDNPNCYAEIDNDCWQLFREYSFPPEFGDWNYDKQRRWQKDNTLADSSDEFEDVSYCGYGSGNCYGGDILQALAHIVGIRVGSV